MHLFYRLISHLYRSVSERKKLVGRLFILRFFKKNQFQSPRWLIKALSWVKVHWRPFTPPSIWLHLRSYVPHCLLLGYCSYLNRNRRIPVGDMGIYIAYLFWAFCLSDVCPVHRRRGVRVSSHPCCWTSKRHTKGAGIVRKWWGFNYHLNLIGTERAKTYCTSRRIIIRVVLGNRHK